MYIIIIPFLIIAGFFYIKRRVLVARKPPKFQNNNKYVQSILTYLSICLFLKSEKFHAAFTRASTVQSFLFIGSPNIGLYDLFGFDILRRGAGRAGYLHLSENPGDLFLFWELCNHPGGPADILEFIVTGACSICCVEYFEFDMITPPPQ